jgi:hypothetical protein
MCGEAAIMIRNSIPVSSARTRDDADGRAACVPAGSCVHIYYLDCFIDLNIRLYGRDYIGLRSWEDGYWLSGHHFTQPHDTTTPILQHSRQLLRAK